MKQELQDFNFTLCNDYAFKKLFGGSDSKPALREFLSLVLKTTQHNLAEITIENPFTEQEYRNDKQGILDIKLTLQNGRRINLEMQNRSQSFLPERILFYWANRYTEDFSIGQSYAMLRKCIHITLINEHFEYADRIHSLYKLVNMYNYKEFRDLLELHFLNLSKIPYYNNINEIHLETMSELEKWLLFIRTNNPEVRNMLAKDNIIMDNANQTMNRFFSNKEERRKYEAAFRYECDRASLLAEGHKQGQLEIAKNLLGLKLSVKDIAKATGLSEETILHL